MRPSRSHPTRRTRWCRARSWMSSRHDNRRFGGSVEEVGRPHQEFVRCRRNEKCVRDGYTLHGAKVDEICGNRCLARHSRPYPPGQSHVATQPPVATTCVQLNIFARAIPQGSRQHNRRLWGADGSKDTARRVGIGADLGEVPQMPGEDLEAVADPYRGVGPNIHLHTIR
eukprot:1817044-Rhodomonas_salina.1